MNPFIHIYIFLHSWIGNRLRLHSWIGKRLYLICTDINNEKKLLGVQVVAIRNFKIKSNWTYF